MTIDHDFAMKFWDAIFGNTKYALDCFGIWICRDAYSNEPVVMKDHQGSNATYYYSWNIDHIRPKSSFQNENYADDLNNFEPMHRQNNLAKSNNYPVFTINGKQYRVVPNANGGYGIVNNNGVRVDWKKDGRHYRN